MSESIYGSLRGVWNVEQGILSAYTAWMPEYLAEVERQNGLQPKELPRPGTIEASDDLEGWEGAELPAIIVIVTPDREVEETGEDYQQAFEIQVGCIAEGQSEAEARKYAGLYGVASMLLAQIELPAGLLEEIQMTAAPKLELVENDQRRLCRSLAAFHAVTTVLTKGSVVGVTPEESPYFQGLEEPPRELPEVTSETLTVKGEPI